MLLAELRAIRTLTSRQAMNVAINHARQWPRADGAQTITECRPVWFALITCGEPELKKLWGNPSFKRWWAVHAGMLAGIFRLAPDKVAVDHESPLP